LSDESGVRAMCDFVVFYSDTSDPDRIHVWVVNLKSKNKGNNAAQMRAGGRLASFLIGKFEDLLTGVKIGKTNFVLFSSTLIFKSGTNPFLSQSGIPVAGKGSLAEPKNFPGGVNPKLAPI
jgi:hypothetical protein